MDLGNRPGYQQWQVCTESASMLSYNPFLGLLEVGVELYAGQTSGDDEDCRHDDILPTTHQACVLPCRRISSATGKVSSNDCSAADWASMGSMHCIPCQPLYSISALMRECSNGAGQKPPMSRMQYWTAWVSLTSPQH